MEQLSKSLDFKYKIVNPPDSAWGMINKTGVQFLRHYRDVPKLP